MNSNLPLLQPLTQYRSIRTRRTRNRFPEIYNLTGNTSNINNQVNYNSDTDQDYIRCPVCNQEFDIYELFTHLFLAHEEFLAVWSSLTFPSLETDNTDSLNTFFRTLGISNDILNTQNTNNTVPYIDGFDLLSYEQLTTLCDEIGYHKIGITNIDSVAPATIKMKKKFDEDRCPICLEDMHKALYMRIIKTCGHEYCGECIENWLKEHKTCPICKLELCEPNETDKQDNNDNKESSQISSISESFNGGNDLDRLSPTPIPESSSSESFANTI